MKIVVYTSYTGKYDKLRDPIFINENIDYLCFTDDKNFKSSIWQVNNLDLSFKNNRRNSRLHKIKPHLFFEKYDWSIYIDSNVIIRGDLNKLIDEVKSYNFSIYKHPYNTSTLIEEAQTIIKNKLDDEEIIRKQIEKYSKEVIELNKLSFPTTTILIRKHNNDIVKKTMDTWWEEYMSLSQRDQMSILYSAHINKLELNILNNNVNNNEYFYKTKHYSKMIFVEKLQLIIMYFLKKNNYNFILKMLKKYMGKYFDKNF